MRKIATIVGARPQFVKAAVVSRCIAASDSLSEVMVHTGQHFDERMSEVFFRDLSIPAPAYNLGVSSLSHGAMTGRMLEEIEKVLITETPDLVLVYGDTNSTLAGALAARKLHVQVAHVEAGLRSFDMRMPEEINRILTDRISDVLYCPTETAVANLRKEGFGDFESRIVTSGDVMYDAVMHFRGRGSYPGELPEKFVLCTIHRAENTDDPERLRRIFSALDEICAVMPVVLPIHPRTRPLLDAYGIATKVTLVDPVGYIEMLDLVERCSVVMTDSGGLQKEAFFLGKVCVTLRDVTEWTELVDGGFNFIAGADREKIVNAFHAAVTATPDFTVRLYGSGNAGELIVQDLENHLT